MTRVNVELIRAMRAQLQTDPEHWIQGSWVLDLNSDPDQSECGTAYCAAGWAAVITGWWIREGNEFVPLRHIRTVTGLTDSEILTAAEIPAPRAKMLQPEIHIADAAAVLLGLDGIRVPLHNDGHRDFHMSTMKCRYPGCDGVTMRAADALFSSGNGLPEIDAIISQIFAAAGIEA